MTKTELNKWGKIYEKLLNKYKYRGPKIREYGRTPFWLEREGHREEQSCDDCGGRIVEDHEYVCQDCGLIHDPIVSGSLNAYKNTTESSYRKKIREINHYKRLNKNTMNREKFGKVQILKEVHVKLIKYCKENHIVQYKFVSDLIDKAVSD